MQTLGLALAVAVILRYQHVFTAGDTHLRYVKITAVRGASLRNAPLQP